MRLRTYNELQSNLFFEELARHGLKHAFIAPGSRSTPLVLAAETQKEITKTVHFDERGLGFLALGASKKSHLPSAIITTSGTATANLLPSIVEAFYSETPLLVLTADRPFELVEVGANQAIQQKNLYQNFVVQEFDVPAPNDKTLWTSILTLAAHAYQTAIQKKGPVHINFRFQEPLAPLINEIEDSNIPENILKYFESREKFVSYGEFKSNASEIKLSPELFKNKGAILVGPMMPKEDLDAIFKISQTLNYPVFCDVQSPMRFYEFRENIHLFDLLLDLDDSEKPEVVLHFGGSFTSKRMNQWISKSQCQYIQVHPLLKRLDANHLTKHFYETTAQKFYEALKPLPIVIPRDYVNQFIQKNEILKETLDQELGQTLNELSLPYHLMKHKRSQTFFVGSSMPVRDLERFAPKGQRQEVYFNRGASGIDGNIATALGISIVQKHDMICLLGDLATLYDLNTLAVLKNHPFGFKLIVVNNDGGGIFSFLPVAQIDSYVDKSGVFEKYFSTPHGQSFEKLAHGFDLKYFNPTTPNELEEALATRGHAVIEIKSQREENLNFHKALTQKLKS